MTEVIIDDKQMKEDEEKIVKLHNFIEKLFPDRDVYVDCVDNKISWQIKNRSDKWKSK